MREPIMMPQPDISSGGGAGAVEHNSCDTTLADLSLSTSEACFPTGERDTREVAIALSRCSRFDLQILGILLAASEPQNAARIEETCKNQETRFTSATAVRNSLNRLTEFHLVTVGEKENPQRVVICYRINPEVTKEMIAAAQSRDLTFYDGWLQQKERGREKLERVVQALVSQPHGESSDPSQAIFRTVEQVRKLTGIAATTISTIFDNLEAGQRRCGVGPLLNLEGREYRLEMGADVAKAIRLVPMAPALSAPAALPE